MNPKVQKALEVSKKNWISITCGVIALLAMGAIFYPISGLYTAQRATLAARTAVYTQFTSLLNQQRKKPTLDPDNPTEDVLQKFPSPEMIEAGDKARAEVELKSRTMLKAVVDLNRHTLLVPGSLPAPTPTVAFNFRDIFLGNKDHKSWDRLITEDILGSTVPPAQADVTAATAALRSQEDQKLQFNAAGVATNQAAVDAEFNDAATKIPDQLRTQAALTHKIYAGPEVVAHTMELGGNAQPTPLQVWNAQLWLWIQQEVAGSLAAANASSANIVEAPIKRWLKFNTVGDLFASAAGADPAAAVPKETGISTSGRVSNALYDVVRFDLGLVVEASKLPLVIQNMERNRLLYVNRVDIISVDSAIDQSNGFIYGSKPVVAVTLRCELLFMRDWTTEFMPPAVKTRLGIVTAPPVTPG